MAVNRSFRFPVVRLSGPLKRLVARQFVDSLETLDDMTFKETVDPRIGKTPREVLQIIGTVGYRRVDPDFWVKLAMQEVESYRRMKFHGVVVPDVRFVNEVEAIQKAGGVLWRIVKVGGETTTAATHVSETALDFLSTDVTLIAEAGDMSGLRQLAISSVPAECRHNV